MPGATFYPDTKYAPYPDRVRRDFTAAEVDEWAEWLASIIERTDVGSRNLSASTIGAPEWSMT